MKYRVVLCSNDFVCKIGDYVIRWRRGYYRGSNKGRDEWDGFQGYWK